MEIKRTVITPEMAKELTTSNTLKHARLRPESEQKARKVYRMLRDVIHSKTEQEWVDGFLFDQDYDGQIRWWMRLAKRYQRQTHRDMLPFQKKQIYQDILVEMMEA